MPVTIRRIIHDEDYGLCAASPLDSLAVMWRSTRFRDRRSPSAFLLAPGRGFRYYRLVILIISIVSIVGVVLADRWIGPSEHNLPPIESLAVLISALSSALAGLLVGLTTSLVGVGTAFLLVADFGSTRGTVNALVSGAVWLLAAVGTGVVASRLRRQVANRQTALEESLSQSLASRDTLEHLLDINPQLQRGETLEEVAITACESALGAFDANNVRVFRLSGTKAELLAVRPQSDSIKPGFALSTTDIPDFDLMLAKHRPLFVHDARQTNPTGLAAELRDGLQIVSNLRLPIVGPNGPEGMLSLSWDHAVDKPEDSCLAAMRRFADQTAIAWHNALRMEAQRKANDLHETLERLVQLAPSFHITGSPQVVAKAICQAALGTFECDAAALCQAEGSRLRLLDRLPPSASLPPGRIFPLSSDMQLALETHSRQPTFMGGLDEPSRSPRPWPAEVIGPAGVSSCLCVPLSLDERGPAYLLILNWESKISSPDQGFMAIVQRFADQASLALAHSSAERLHARLEASLLPTAPVDHPSLTVVTRYRTGEQRLHLGGDFLGAVASEKGLLHFVLGDVSGHGPDAAALGATLRSTWKALTLSGQSLVRTTQIMASLIQGERNTPNAFATVLVGRIDPHKATLTWINAGHMPPLLISDQVRPLESDPILPLGVGTVTEGDIHSHNLPRSWSLFCYTDGLVDARITPSSPTRYGEERLRERLNAWSGRSPDGYAIDELLVEVESASGSRFADDVAVLLISTKD